MAICARWQNNLFMDKDVFADREVDRAKRIQRLDIRKHFIDQILLVEQQCRSTSDDVLNGRR
jgi:hypothetical protein